MCLSFLGRKLNRGEVRFLRFLFCPREEGVDCVYVEGLEDWYECLEFLVNNRRERERLAESAYKAFTEKYSVGIVYPKLKKFLTKDLIR